MVAIECRPSLVKAFQGFCFPTTGTHLVPRRSVRTDNWRTKNIASYAIYRPTQTLAAPVMVIATPPRPMFSVTIANDQASAINITYLVFDIWGYWIRMIISHFATLFSGLVRGISGVSALAIPRLFCANYTLFPSRTQILEEHR
jgi:hypothetical protein